MKVDKSFFANNFELWSPESSWFFDIFEEASVQPHMLLNVMDAIDLEKEVYSSMRHAPSIPVPDLTIDVACQTSSQFDTSVCQAANMPKRRRRHKRTKSVTTNARVHPKDINPNLCEQNEPATEKNVIEIVTCVKEGSAVTRKDSNNRFKKLKNFFCRWKNVSW